MIEFLVTPIFALIQLPLIAVAVSGAIACAFIWAARYFHLHSFVVAVPAALGLYFQLMAFSMFFRESRLPISAGRPMLLSACAESIVVAGLILYIWLRK